MQTVAKHHPSILNRLARAGSILVLACLMVFSSSPALGADNFDEEIRIGKEAADQVAKESKFIEEPEVVKRVDAIGAAITKVAVEKEVPASYGKPNLAKFDYTFKVIDDKDVNAFSLPGGFVYVYKGLLDHAQSDDELAGVIAHEIGHVSHHHAMQLLRTQQKEQLKAIIALLAGAAVGADAGNWAFVANLISMAKLSSYGQKAEFDADRTAVAYLAETNYSPVGMLTFMERLARDELRKPEINYGIFATHPPSKQRAREMIDELEKRGIPINRRLVTSYMHVEVKPVENSQASSVWIGNIEIVKVADSGGEKSAARAQRIADRLTGLLVAGARLHEVKVGGGGQYVVVKDEVLIAPTPDDAALAGTSVPEVTDSAAKALRKALLSELLEQKY